VLLNEYDDDDDDDNEVNSEADFPQLREYCPSAEGQYSRN